MNKYAVYDKNTGAVKGTYSKYLWSKEEPVELTEKEIFEEFKEEFAPEEVAIAKIPDDLAKPTRGTKLVFDLTQRQLIAVKREIRQQEKK